MLPRSSSSSTLRAKIRRTLESRPHPICPHRRTQGARTRTSRGPPTAQDPPARCVTPLALFDTFRSRAYHSYPTGIHTFGHVLRAGRLSFVANKRCASDERRRAWRLAGIASGRWAAGGFAPVREMAECAVRRAPLPLTAVAEAVAAARCRSPASGRLHDDERRGRRAAGLCDDERQGGRAPPLLTSPPRSPAIRSRPRQCAARPWVASTAQWARRTSPASTRCVTCGRRSVHTHASIFTSNTTTTASTHQHGVRHNA